MMSANSGSLLPLKPRYLSDEREEKECGSMVVSLFSSRESSTKAA